MIKVIRTIPNTILILVLLASILSPVLLLTMKVLAAEEALTTPSNKTSAGGVRVNITDLQVTGDEEEVTVNINIAGDGYLDVGASEDVELNWYGDSEIEITGQRSDVNATLASLYYYPASPGTVTATARMVGNGDVYNSANEHVYQVIADGGITWADANEAAEGMEYGGVNGYLATITSQEEHDFIRNRINDSGWIGASDEGVGNEGVWRWVTGPEAGTQFWAGDENGSRHNGAYANWNPGEPNNSGEGENCGQIYFTEESDGDWNDLDCSSDENEYYVVEFGAPGNLPDMGSVSFDITTTSTTQELSTCEEFFALDDTNSFDTISLSGDIDCHNQTVEPLFYTDAEFMGVVEGNGYTIKNVVINNPEGTNIGIFGSASDASFSNLFLDNIHVTGNQYVGTLIGDVDEGVRMNNVHAANSSVTGLDGDAIGGLIGDFESEGDVKSEISSVSFSGDINVGIAIGVGGLIGDMYTETDTLIYEVFADANITVSERGEYVGGLIGAVEQSYDEDTTPSFELYDAYSWGNITIVDNGEATGEVVGGLVGGIEAEEDNEYDPIITVSRSYANNSIYGHFNVGGLIGEIEMDGDGITDILVEDSFAMGSVGYAENEWGELGGLIANAGSDDPDYLSLVDVYYDRTGTGIEDCVGYGSNAGCTAINIDGTEADYFINNTTNAPMNDWSFDEVWVANRNTPPTFRGLPFSDDDSDGVDNQTENQAPNNGDGNNDGTPDSEQLHVTSLKSDVNDAYVTVEVDDACSLEDVAARAEVTKLVQDSGYDYPGGLVNFGANCGDPGYTTTVRLFFYVLSDYLTVRKYIPSTGAYFTISAATKSAQTVGGQAVTVVSYQITDGGDLDTDGVEDGTIIDPVGLGVLATGSPNTGTSTVRDFLFAR